MSKYYAGVPAEQGMAPPAEIPQHFPQFHPQSDEGDEDDEDDDDSEGNDIDVTFLGVY